METQLSTEQLKQLIKQRHSALMTRYQVDNYCNDEISFDASHGITIDIREDVEAVKKQCEKILELLGELESKKGGK